MKLKIMDACNLASLDRNVFNQAIYAGNYRHAPQVVPGSTRLFGENDLIALLYYSMMIQEGSPSSRAGAHSELLFRSLEEDGREVDWVTIRIGWIGERQAFVGFPDLAADAKTNTGRPVLRDEHISVAPLRAYVRKHMENAT